MKNNITPDYYHLIQLGINAGYIIDAPMERDGTYVTENKENINEKNLRRWRDTVLMYDHVEEISYDDLPDDLIDLLSDDVENKRYFQLNKKVDVNKKQRIIIVENNDIDKQDIIKQVEAEEGLEIVSTTINRNGYPSNVNLAALVPDEMSWDEIEDIKKKYGLEIVSLYKEAGWDLYYNEGTIIEQYDVSKDIEDYGYDCYSRNKEEFIKDLLINSSVFILPEIPDIKDDEIILFEYNYPTEFKITKRYKNSIHWDNKYRNIALMNYDNIKYNNYGK